jgi:deoxyribodipyrimidine photo-lyase
VPGEVPSASEEVALARWREFLDDGVSGYKRARDRPDRPGTSRMSVHLKYGTVHPRTLLADLAGRSGEGADSMRSELAWREFYADVLWHRPDSARANFDRRFDVLAADSGAEADAHFTAWTEGRTGFPIVDAGMRQLRETGWMHNRVRLVVGSFLTKDLHLDWRAGEAWFARLLLDGEPAQNTGNWQWIASVGADPAPAFRRMYNPARHQERFDPDGAYVRRWVPELRDVPPERLSEPWTMSAEEQSVAGCVIGRDYPEPIVDHAAERRRALERYRAAG